MFQQASEFSLSEQRSLKYFSESSEFESRDLLHLLLLAVEVGTAIARMRATRIVFCQHGTIFLGFGIRVLGDVASLSMVYYFLRAVSLYS